MSDNGEVNVAVFGSCISRDILDVLENDGSNISPGVYVARQSFVSSMMPAESIDPDSIELSSAFQRRVLGWDINKQAFSIMRSRKADYLMIDFFEERFDLAVYRDTIITYSNEFCRSGLDHGKRIAW